MNRRDSGVYGFGSPSPIRSRSDDDDLPDEFGGFDEISEDEEEYGGFGFESPEPERIQSGRYEPMKLATSKTQSSVSSLAPQKSSHVSPKPVRAAVATSQKATTSAVSSVQGISSSSSASAKKVTQEPETPASKPARKFGSTYGVSLADRLKEEEAQRQRAIADTEERLRAERARQERIKKEREAKVPKPAPLSAAVGQFELRRAQSVRPGNNKAGEASRAHRFTSQHNSPGPVANFSLLAQTMNTLRSPKVETRNEDDYEELDPKAIEAAKWTDKEIRKLIQVIKDEGQVGQDGKWYIEFGVLFEATANLFDALSGICKTAKKYKVVSYNVEQLWQGMHDKEVITLLKDHHDGIEIKKRKKLSVMTAPSALAFKRPSMQTLNAKCHVCSKTVYPMEFVGASDHAFHKNCFRCATCNHTLSMNDYNVSRDGNFRCRAHHEAFEKVHM